MLAGELNVLKTAPTPETTTKDDEEDRQASVERHGKVWRAALGAETRKDRGEEVVAGRGIDETRRCCQSSVRNGKLTGVEAAVECTKTRNGDESAEYQSTKATNGHAAKVERDRVGRSDNRGVQNDKVRDVGGKEENEDNGHRRMESAGKVAVRVFHLAADELRVRLNWQATYRALVPAIKRPETEVQRSSVAPWFLGRPGEEVVRERRPGAVADKVDETENGDEDQRPDLDEGQHNRRVCPRRRRYQVQ